MTFMPVANNNTLTNDGMGFVEAVLPDLAQDKTSISPVNANRDYTMVTTATDASYTNIAEGGGLTGLGVKYGIGGGGEDFSTEQFGVSIESDLKMDNPQGCYIFIKARSQLVYNANGVQLLQ